MGKLYLFNPTAEIAAAANTRAYKPPAHLQRFEQELAFLPLVFCGSSDYVLAEKKPSKDLCSIWSKLGLYCDNILQPGASIPVHLVPELWADAPNSALLLKNTGLKPPQWTDVESKIYRRETALELWAGLEEHGFLQYGTKPEFIDDKDRFKKEVEEGGGYIAKLNFTASGRGVYAINKNTDALVLRRIEKLCHRGLLVEPLYNKRVDFSLHFTLSRSACSFDGVSVMKNDNDGSYSGSYVNYPIAEFFSQHQISEIQRLTEFYIKSLPDTVYAKEYDRPVGVDCMLCVSSSGEEFIQPCVEINARYTMGRVALACSSLVTDGTRAEFFIYNKLRKSGVEPNIDLSVPCEIKANQLIKGVLPLSDFGKASFLAGIRVV